MFTCASLMMKIWHFALPEPRSFNSKLHTVICVHKALMMMMMKIWHFALPEPRSFNSKLHTVICVHKALPLPCIVVSAIDRRSIRRLNLLSVRYLVRFMLDLPPLFLLFVPKNWLTSFHMSMPLMPSL